jgi:bacterioferritin-associated ferredoxin
LNEEEIIVCRCMEVTDKEIREAIRLAASIGSISIQDQVKKLTSAGMGLCQGRTCQQLIERLIFEETGKTPNELPPMSTRPPTKPIKLVTLGEMER